MEDEIERQHTHPAWTMPLFGVPVTVKPAFFLIIAVLGASRLPDFAGLVSWILVGTFSILWHEFGHVLGFRAFGVESRVELWSFGGLTWPESPLPEDKPSQDILVSLAGPAAGLLLGGVVLVLARAIDPTSAGVRTVVTDILWINIGWSLVNLIPLVPLDGGRVMAATLRAIFRGKERKAANVVSIAVAVAGGVYALSQGDYWLVFMAFWLGNFNAQQLALPARAPEGTVDADASPRLIPWIAEALDDLAQGKTREVERAARRELQRATDQRATMRAAWVLLWALLLSGRTKDASAVADSYLEEMVYSGTLKPEFSSAVQGPDRVIALLSEAVYEHRSPVLAVHLVQALIETEQFEEAQSLALDPAFPAADKAAAMVQIEFCRRAEWREAVALGRRFLADRSDPGIAFNTACSCARLGLTEEGAQWLQRAVEAGFDDLKQLESDPDLEPLRDTATYQRVRAGMAAR